MKICGAGGSDSPEQNRANRRVLPQFELTRLDKTHR